MVKLSKLLQSLQNGCFLRLVAKYFLSDVVILQKTKYKVLPLSSKFLAFGRCQVMNFHLVT